MMLKRSVKHPCKSALVLSGISAFALNFVGTCDKIIVETADIMFPVAHKNLYTGYCYIHILS